MAGKANPPQAAVAKKNELDSFRNYALRVKDMLLNKDRYHELSEAKVNYHEKKMNEMALAYDQNKSLNECLDEIGYKDHEAHLEHALKQVALNDMYDTEVKDDARLRNRKSKHSKKKPRSNINALSSASEMSSEGDDDLKWTPLKLRSVYDLKCRSDPLLIFLILTAWIEEVRSKLKVGGLKLTLYV
eukprot:244625_1